MHPAALHPATRPVLFLATAAATLALSVDAALAAGDAASHLSNGLELAREGIARTARWIEAGYARRPAVVIGLGAALALPVLVLIGLWVHRKHSHVESRVPLADPIGPQAVRIEIDGAPPVVLPRGRDLLQIGRHEDNDICIPDATVSRYHAVIERSGDSGFVITDISSPDGSGLLINGARRLRAPLAAGDTVELGRARLRLAAAM